MKNNTNSKGGKIILLCILFMAAVIVIDAFVMGATPKAGVANDAAQTVEANSAVTITTAEDWAKKYPDQYNSYLRAAENTEAEDYVEMYPFLSTVYEGTPFGTYYSGARGHAYTLDDVSETGRPHGQAKCITCKSPDYVAMVNAQGVEMYTKDFEEIMANMNEPVSCYSCHANTGDELVVTHLYLADAVGEDLAQIDPATLSCGQCHVEYYFVPETQAVALPYSNLATMSPDEILAFYNEMGFVDYTNPRTGTPQIKVQHTEFETFMGEGSAHAGLLSCADCHMGVANSDQGYGTGTYTDHNMVSPFAKDNDVLASCVQCHGNTDMEFMAHRVQDEIETRTCEVGEKLALLCDELAAAVESGSLTEDQLAELRSLHRDATFYWDFVFVENSEGAHNSALSRDCLDKAEALIDQALDLL